VKHRPDLLSRVGYLAGDDERRATELMEMIEDPGVAGIVCARGGYGCHRIVSQIDWRRVRSARKPLVGFSDATTLLLAQRRLAGLVGIHGPMLGRAVEPAEREALVGALTGRARGALLRGEPGARGRAEGRLVGGNLAVLVASLGTPWEIDTRGAILLLEEVGEKPYRIDRMLEQLRAAGKLSQLAGVGIGWLVDCEDPRYPEPPAAEVIGRVVESLGVPFATQLPVGHQAPNLAWPHGGRARLDGGRGELRIVERGVE
jgi:muramoyltetrapeptide carboxypeptidase